MSNFRSNAEEIRFYAKELLQDGAMHTREEIMQYVKDHSSNARNFTEGMYTGAIRDLIVNSNGDYINPIRGRYQRAPQSSRESAGQKMKNDLINVLTEACEGMKRACTINIIGVSQEELSIAEKADEIIKNLKIIINELESQY